MRSKCSSSVIQLAEPLHLEQFAFDHLLRQFDQCVENAEIPLLHRHLEGLHVEPVAGQHAFRIAPLRIGRGPSAPRLSLIDDVIVHQRRGMNDLDDRAQTHRAASLIMEQFGGKKKKCGTYAFAAAIPQIFSDLGDGLHTRHGIGILPKLALRAPQQDRRAADRRLLFR